MRRLLTSYAVVHNRRHRRSGHLFQNRYKSILCQEDAYLKVLVRYIHLNPIRAGIVKDMGALDRYRYAGHSFIVGKQKNSWQSVNEALAIFGRKKGAARDSYREFVIKGIELGRQPELVGGGLIRSAGGWASVQSLRKAGLFQKSDERILGDGDFVDSVLNYAQESSDKRYRLATKGIQFEDVFAAVVELLSVQPIDLLGPSKQRTIVKGRALCCYWSVRELGMSMSDVADRLKIAGPTVSVAVKKGGKIVSEEGLVLSRVLNVKI